MKTFILKPEGSRWILSEEGGRVASTYANKTDALRASSRRVSKEFGVLIIRREDGIVEEERRFPAPPEIPNE